jgi:hypothetical protein
MKYQRRNSRVALPREAREASNFNNLRKSLGRECPIDCQHVSTSAPKLLRRRARAAFGAAAERFILPGKTRAVTSRLPNRKVNVQAQPTRAANECFSPKKFISGDGPAAAIAPCPLLSKSGQAQARSVCPLSAISGLMHRSKQCCYSMTSSALVSKVCGTVRPSVFAVLRLSTNSNLVGN